MTGDERERRDSRALEPELIADPQARAVAEASNGFRQYDAAIAIIQNALERGSFKLRPSMILGLQREALAGISSYAGNYRPGGVAIEGSKHEPVGAHLVPELVEDMCDYVNDAADLAFKNGQVGVSKMEELLASLLANQLAGFYRAVGGKLPE
ncbi:MAG TPA: hypothetical protein VGO01_11105 [Bradyrhizobium sp.]|jgi:hypothetical protein|nr:hypothetical protein [Bradyrhizobium sp.]